MKVTVNKYLNARIGNPSTTAACNFFQTPGNTIVIDKVVTGEELDGNSVWYHCEEDGCFYWSGGIEEVAFQLMPLDQFGGDKNGILAEAIKYLWNDWKRDIEGFNGAFTGDKITGGNATGSKAIVFQVLVKSQDTQSIKNLIPAEIFFKGFAIKTDVIQTTYATFEAACPGDSISRIHEIDENGTVSLKVYRGRKEGDDYYLLTNYHVACFDLLRSNKLIFSPGENVINRQVMVPRQAVDPANTEFIGALSEGRLSANYDIALILLNDKDEAANTVDGFTIREYIDVYDGPDNYTGQNATLYGATSGRRTKPIISIHSHQVFTYAGANKIELVKLLQMERFSDAGDSGSPVLLGRKIIGIHVGSDDKFSYAIPIKRILNFFKLKISES